MLYSIVDLPSLGNQQRPSNVNSLESTTVANSQFALQFIVIELF